MTTPAPELHSVGEIAEATGLTVRTLHYYEEIGLLVPSVRTSSGHRRYGRHDVERLYRIALLRQLGLSLDGIRGALDDDAQDLGGLMTEHLTVVDERLAAEHRLRARLARAVDRLATGPASPTPDLLDLLEDMTMLETTIDRRISILVYEDIEAAIHYLTRVFGFGPGSLSRDDEGTVVHGEIHAGDGEFWLHRESAEFSLASPRTLGAATGTMAVLVDDVDAHHRHAVAEGAEVQYEPVDQPYGYREYSAVDLEGHLWSFMKPLDPASP